MYNLTYKKRFRRLILTLIQNYPAFEQLLESLIVRPIKIEVHES